ncbi:MAG: ATP-binding cassette domain-containing protein [Oscillospiraceae bacterium]|nr:ATP-binding cassette domain-containing protein [Oscillospiraceae bacterium]MBR6982299.1 ATP-binding cassette domain-containing protein [Ruminococcus sp.]
MLQVKNISLSYNDEVVLDKINLSVDEGKCLVILGPSGCGKTTLLHLMAGLKHPNHGVIEYRGENVVKPIQEISMIFQGYGLFPWKTVRENLILPYKIRKEKVNENELTDVVEELGLKKHLEKYPSQLSGGQKQRVAIGRAMLNNARIVLMDEPFSAIDINIKKNLEVRLKTLFKNRKITVVMVTHSMEEALVWGDQIAVFQKNGVTFDKVIDNPYKGLIEKKEEFLKMIS